MWSLGVIGGNDSRTTEVWKMPASGLKPLPQWRVAIGECYAPPAIARSGTALNASRGRGASRGA